MNKFTQRNFLQQNRSCCDIKQLIVIGKFVRSRIKCSSTDFAAIAKLFLSPWKLRRRIMRIKWKTGALLSEFYDFQGNASTIYVT